LLFSALWEATIMSPLLVTPEHSITTAWMIVALCAFPSYTHKTLIARTARTSLSRQITARLEVRALHRLRQHGRALLSLALGASARKLLFAIQCQ
jgi:hypothetical protein